MKKLHLFSAGILALAMTACDSDEPMGNNPGGGSADGSGQYIAVSILNADAAPTGRAIQEGDEDGQIKYINGSTEENAINQEQLHFLFFDDKGNPFAMTGTNINGKVQTETEGEGKEATETATNWIKPTKVSSGTINNSTPGNQSTTTAVLVLGTASGSYKGNIPSRIVCIANVEDKVIKENFANKKIDELLGKDAMAFENLYSIVDGKATNFIMSSSSWYDGNETVCWSNIQTRNIQSSSEAATGAPVEIYIERLAARVTVSEMPKSAVVKRAAGDGYEAMPFSYNDVVEGEVKTIEGKNILAVPTGWVLNNDTKSANGIKKLAGAEAYFNAASDWNIGVRSYWASTTINETVANFTPNTLTNKVNEIVYAHANTADPFLRGNGESGVTTLRGQQHFARTYATKILVGANFYIVDEGETTVPEGATPANIMYWGGMYYTPEALCKVLSRDLEKGKYVAYSRVYEITSANTGHYMVKFYTVTSESLAGTNITPTTGNAPQNATIISNVPAAQCWSGMGYYILNISNDLISTKGDYANKNMYGVVRNHAYTYELTDFVGLGTPVPCTDIETRVENPAVSNTYVAARLNVLNWRLVSNKTILQ